MDKALEKIGEKLKKLNIELPNDSASLLLGIYPKELRIGTQMKNFTHVYSRITHSSQKGETTQMPTER